MSEQTTKSRIGRRALVAAGLAGALIGAGVTAYATTATPTAKKTDVWVHTTKSVNLSASGGVKKTVMKLKMPAGKWVFSVDGNFVNFGVSDYTRCALKVGTHTIASISTLVGNPDGGTAPSSELSTFAMIGAISLHSSATAIVQCWHDGDGTQPYVDPGASMWAHKTSSLQGVSE